MIDIQDILTVSHLDALHPTLFEKALVCLPKDKQEKIRKYHHITDQYRSLIAEITVRTHMMKKLNVSNTEIHFKTGAFGKPYLVGPSDLHYNVSHSGQWVACMFDYLPVGIDVEEIAPIDLEIAKMYFTRAEYDALFRQSPNERLAYFFDLWTLKESFIKAVGKGLSIPLDSFSFLKNDEGYQFYSAEYPKNHYYFKHYDIDPNYKLAVCSQHNCFVKDPTQLTATEICLEFSTLIGG